MPLPGAQQGDIWSGLTTRIVRTKRTNLPKRTRPVHGVVLHTTGGGIITKALKLGEDPLEYAAAYYARAKSYASNYLIGPFSDPDFDGSDDVIIGTIHEGLVSYHSSLPTSSARYKTYRKGRKTWPRYRIGTINGKKTMVDQGKGILPDYKDWLRRWPDLESPLDLNPVPSAGINRNFVGVDLLAPEPGMKHTELQLRWAAALVSDIFERHGIPLERKRFLRHSDVDPFSRSTKRGGWDPPGYAHERVCELLDLDYWPHHRLLSPMRLTP